MTALCIAVGLTLLACLFVVGFGVRAALDFCAEMERDRRVEYRITPRLSRPEPKWIGRTGQ